LEIRTVTALVMEACILLYLGEMRGIIRFIHNEDMRDGYSPGLVDPFRNKQTKQTPWPLVRERTIPTERPPLVDEI
jgi:hypothetical protein